MLHFSVVEQDHVSRLGTYNVVAIWEEKLSRDAVAPNDDPPVPVGSVSEAVDMPIENAFVSIVLDQSDMVIDVSPRFDHEIIANYLLYNFEKSCIGEIVKVTKLDGVLEAHV